MIFGSYIQGSLSILQSKRHSLDSIHRKERQNICACQEEEWSRPISLLHIVKDSSSQDFTLDFITREKINEFLLMKTKNYTVLTMFSSIPQYF